MTTALVTHDDCLLHDNPPGHPESVDRLRAVTLALRSAEFAPLRWVDAPLASDEQILRAHSRALLNQIRTSVPQSGFAALDADTTLSRGSLNAALRAAGAACAAVDLVMLGDAKNAFCATRPPGHHAEIATAMGFCIFNNIAIAAKHALSHWNLACVAIVDFDVHHGNGTQDIAWNDPRIAYVSSHQSPLYPGTGAETERGAGGNVLNLQLPPNAGSKEFRARMELDALPFLEDFKPELLLVSAGFDAHRADPLANINLSETDFAWITSQLCDCADKHCQGRIVSTLEGGYDLDALATSVAAHVRVLMERGA